MSLKVYEAVARVKRRNKDLSTALAQCRLSRDQWKQKAVDRSRQNTRLRQKIKRLEARVPARRPVPKRKPSAEEWTTHDRILERILSFSPRDILSE